MNRCRAITGKGKQCSRRQVENVCWQHKDERQLIITVPHACTVDTFLDEDCDLNSEEIAQIVHKRIKSSLLVISDIPRFACDNNRKKCRTSNMRKKLRFLLEEYQESSLIIDIHTFQSGSSFDINFEPDVILLDTHLSEETKTLAKELVKANFTIVVFQGVENDIQTETREFGGKAVLIEFHQRISNTNVKLIASIIEDWKKYI